MKINPVILITLVLCRSLKADLKTEMLNVTMRDCVKLATGSYRDNALKHASVFLIQASYDPRPLADFVATRSWIPYNHEMLR